MPVFDQSGLRHVLSFGSKIRTPSFIDSMMLTLDCSNAVCSSSDQWKGVFGLNRGLDVSKGFEGPTGLFKVSPEGKNDFSKAIFVDFFNLAIF